MSSSTTSAAAHARPRKSSGTAGITQGTWICGLLVQRRQRQHWWRMRTEHGQAAACSSSSSNAAHAWGTGKRRHPQRSTVCGRATWIGHSAVRDNQGQLGLGRAGCRDVASVGVVRYGEDHPAPLDLHARYPQVASSAPHQCLKATQKPCRRVCAWRPRGERRAAWRAVRRCLHAASTHHWQLLESAVDFAAACTPRSSATRRRRRQLHRGGDHKRRQ